MTPQRKIPRKRAPSKTPRPRAKIVRKLFAAKFQRMNYFFNAGEKKGPGKNGGDTLDFRRFFGYTLKYRE
jgi:hypothetical protein